MGTILGPIVGGSFAQSSVTWRMAFYINLVVGGVIAPMILFAVPRTELRHGVAGTYSGVYDSLSGDQRPRVIAAVIAAMSDVWIMLAVAGASSVILSLFLGVGLVGFLFSCWEIWLTLANFYRGASFSVRSRYEWL